jgi:outer membrane receptor protein involved in Fe transport
VPETHQAQVGNQEGFVAQGKNNFTQFNAQAIAVWNNTSLNGDLDLTTQFGITYLDQESNLVNSRGSDLTGGQTNVDQSVNQVIDQFFSTEKDYGYFAQVEGNYKDQFIATLGYRLDKSSRNGDPNKLYGFPKASLAVNIANLDFWSVEAVNQFKIRAAYGETGNPASFGATFTSLGSSNTAGNGGTSVAGLKGDPDVEPETASEFEVGFDLGFLNSRVSLEATYYHKKVSDLILSRSLPASSGFTTETTNLADLKNEGLELAVRADVLDSDNFHWNTGIQLYLNRSEVTRLEVPAFALQEQSTGAVKANAEVQPALAEKVAVTVELAPSELIPEIL